MPEDSLSPAARARSLSSSCKHMHAHTHRHTRARVHHRPPAPPPTPTQLQKPPAPPHPPPPRPHPTPTATCLHLHRSQVYLASLAGDCRCQQPPGPEQLEHQPRLQDSRPRPPAGGLTPVAAGTLLPWRSPWLSRGSKAKLVWGVCGGVGERPGLQAGGLAEVDSPHKLGMLSLADHLISTQFSSKTVSSEVPAPRTCALESKVH